MKAEKNFSALEEKLQSELRSDDRLLSLFEAPTRMSREDRGILLALEKHLD